MYFQIKSSGLNYLIKFKKAFPLVFKNRMYSIQLIALRFQHELFNSWV